MYKLQSQLFTDINNTWQVIKCTFCVTCNEKQ